MSIVLYIDEFSRISPAKDAMISLLNKMGITPIIFNGISGRTMLSMGMLRWARRVIAGNLRRLSKYQDAEVVFLEPSAWSVFRDEASALLNPQDAKPTAYNCHSLIVNCQLKFVLYDEWLLRHSDKLNLHPLDIKYLSSNPVVNFQFSIFNSQLTKILLHEHCHQKALNPSGLSSRLLSLIPDTEVIAVGETCCGMAGAFGYFRKNYDLSMQIGKPLFDEINTHLDAIVSASGISCQKQIFDGTGRHAFHPVELIDLSFH